MGSTETGVAGFGRAVRLYACLQARNRDRARGGCRRRRTAPRVGKHGSVTVEVAVFGPAAIALAHLAVKYNPRARIIGLELAWMIAH